MDFSKAIGLSGDELETEIKRCLECHDWFDEVENLMERGGWPEGGYDQDILEIDNGEDKIEVTFILTFTETVGSNCHDISFTHEGQATYSLTIHKPDGWVELEVLDSEVNDDFNVYNSKASGMDYI